MTLYYNFDLKNRNLLNFEILIYPIKNIYNNQNLTIIKKVEINKKDKIIIIYSFENFILILLSFLVRFLI